MEEKYRRSKHPRQKVWQFEQVALDRVLLALFYGFLGLVTFWVGLFLISQHVVTVEVKDQGIWVYRLIVSIGAFLSSLALASYLSKELGKAFFLKLGVSYVIYLLVSYSLLLTQNINNEDFRPMDFLGNHFFEGRSWWVVLVLIGLAHIVTWLVGKYPSLESTYQALTMQVKPNLGLSLLLSLVVLQDSKLQDNLLQFLYLETSSDQLTFLGAAFYKVSLVILAVALMTYMFWRAIDGIKQNKSTLSLALMTSLLLALVFNYTIQYGIKADTDYRGYFIFPGATLFQLIIFTLLNLTVYLLFNRYWLSTLIIIFSGTVFTIANQTKFIMRSEPVLLTDLSMMSQLDLILSFVDTRLVIAALSLMGSLIAMYLFLKNRYLKGKIFNLRWKGVVLTTTIIASFSGIVTFFSSNKVLENVPVLSRLNNLLNIDFEGHAQRARYQSLSFVWVQQLAKPVMEMPENYNEAKIAELVAKYEKRAKEINATRTQNIADETLIFILSESLADPTRIEGVTLTENVLPNILELKEKTTGGLMKADNYGGGTANMETQSLVGLPLYNLSAYIYNVEVIPKLSILPAISDSFEPENKFAIHLSGTQLYSRADVYNRLKFGTFIADDPSATAPTANSKYGGFPSDASTYQNILDQLDPSESQFFSVITYQNHVPWSMPEPATISGEGVGFTEKENERLSHYARLLKQTDTDTQAFLDQLSKIDKDITVVFYGDHLPGLYPESAFYNNPEIKYLTDYFIWSNRERQRQDYPYLNSSDFPAAVLAHTNSKVSPYYALLTDVLEQASVGQKNLTAKGEEIANDLKLIQYDLISGWSYLEDFNEFFEVVE